MQKQESKFKYSLSFYFIIAMLIAVAVGLFIDVFYGAYFGLFSYAIFYGYHKLTGTELPNWHKYLEKKNAQNKGKREEWVSCDPEYRRLTFRTYSNRR